MRQAMKHKTAKRGSINTSLQMLQGRYEHKGMAYIIKEMTGGPGYLVLGSPKGHLKQLGREYPSLKAADAAARRAIDQMLAEAQ